MDTTVSIGLKNDSRDTQEFKDIQAALDEIDQDTSEEYLQDAVNNAPTA